MSKLETEVLRAVSEYNMLDKGDTVIVALSGGADSVALFNALISVKEIYSLDIKAAHVNHNLRGAEAERDENFVRDICKKNDIELFVKSVDINKIARRDKISTELAGRNERYKFFDELSKSCPAKIATAHTAEDNAETVIFNLIRGAGLNGLGGIKPVRGSVIRPLIFLSRRDIEEYCAENGLEFVTDSTNLTDDYTRNKIRHGIIPLMKELNPSLIDTISGETRLINEINSFLELKSNEYLRLAETENGYSCESLKKIPEEIRSQVFYELLRRNGITPEQRHTALIGSILDSGAVDLNGAFRAVSKQGTLRIVKTGVYEDEFSEKELKLPMEFVFNGNKYSVKELNGDTAEAIKYSVLEKGAVFRTRRPGDSFTLPRRKVTKTLKKLFNEFKIPEEKRDKILVLSSGSEVLWIEGIGASENALSYENKGFSIKIERV